MRRTNCSSLKALLKSYRIIIYAYICFLSIFVFNLRSFWHLREDIVFETLYRLELMSSCQQRCYTSLFTLQLGHWIILLSYACTYMLSRFLSAPIFPIFAHCSTSDYYNETPFLRRLFSDLYIMTLTDVDALDSDPCNQEHNKENNSLVSERILSKPTTSPCTARTAKSLKLYITTKFSLK